MNNSPIEVVEIKKVDGGRLRAYVTVKVDDWLIHDWRIVQKPGEAAWVSCPETTWRGSNGKIYYRQLLTIPAEMMQRITLKILARWEEEKTSEAQKH